MVSHAFGTSLAQIPQPLALPIVGNVPQIDPDRPIQSMMKLGSELGPIYRLRFPTRDFLVVSGHELVDELCDEDRFGKLVHSPLLFLRPMAGNGLFTAETEDPEWGVAHRVLMPAFGPQAIKGSFDGMLDIAGQLVAKWTRQGEKKSHDVAAEMTQLTLDTIALCGFGFRFNSFYQNELHPFVDAMVRALAEAGSRTRQLPLQTKLKVRAQKQFENDISFMNGIVDELIADRRAGRTRGERDLLSLMLAGRDPVSGRGLTDENIRHQMVTFLIAGHETTSGLLSFALHALVTHPEVLRRAREEVDAVLGTETPRFEHLAKLVYVDQILRETLRLWPTAPAFAVTPRARTTLGNGLTVEAGDDLLVLVPNLHRDRSVWGPNVEAFDPDRFAPGVREQIPAHAWKPFGTGVRACIGRPFAWQEATLVVAMLLQHFDLLPDPSYRLSIKETLTLKPDGFTLRVRDRERAATPSVSRDRFAPTVKASPIAAPTHGTPLTVLYGSNTGSSEAFARRLAGEAEARGWVVDLDTMDSHAGALPKRGALVIVTASYNGHPPDNAARFCAWLDGLAPGALGGLPFAVFGCGHRDWATTFQAVPTRVDAALERAGGVRLIPRGQADARGDFFGDFEAWIPGWWPAVDAALEVPAPSEAGESEVYAITTLDGASREARVPGAIAATVIENRELVDVRAAGARSKRHLVLAIPEGVAWQCGDSVAIQVENPPSVVARALARLRLAPETIVQLSSTRRSAASLPLDQPISVLELLRSYVELSQPATKRQVEQLAAATRCPPERKKLEALAADFRAQVLEPRRSVLDLLEEAPACEISLARVLEMLPRMKPRLYSVASSPKLDATRVALTVSVLRAPAWRGHGLHEGAGSTTLERAEVGQTLWLSVRPPTTPFRVPAPSVPMLLLCAGSGLAPFRGFLEERAAAKRAGATVAPTLLYFGCDHPDVDFLYADELRGWEAEGIVSVRPTFCRAPEGEHVFVQHRLASERDEVRALVASGASIFLCGDGARFAPAVRDALARVLGPDTLEELERQQRYVADVFS